MWGTEVRSSMGASWPGWGSAVTRHRQQLGGSCSWPGHVAGGSARTEQWAVSPAASLLLLAVGWFTVRWHELPHGTYARGCLCSDCFGPASWPRTSPPCWGWEVTGPAAGDADCALEPASGLSTGPRVAGVGCRVATIRPSSSSDIFMSVCYSSGSGWGPAGLRRLCTLKLCGVVWSTVCFLKAKWEVRGSWGIHGPFVRRWCPTWSLGQRNKVIRKTRIPHHGSTGCLFTQLRKGRQAKDAQT